MEERDTNKRLFLAIKVKPSPEFSKTISLLKNNTQRDLINWIHEDHYHITLKFIGKTAVPRIEPMIKAFAHALKSSLAFELNIEKTGVFGSRYSPKVLWFGLDNIQEVQKLKKKIDNSLKPFGFKKDHQNFIPHLTIARIKKVKDIHFFQKLIASVEAKQIQHLEVEEVILYESILRSKGAEYHIIERFLLQKP